MISIPNFQPSDLSPEDLESISKVLRKHNIEKIRFGTNNRLSVELPEGTDLDAVIDELDEFSKPGNANGITYVRSCPAKDQCKYSCADAPEIGKRIENIELPRPLTAKVKVSIAGCHMCCSEPYIRDIGLVATKKGWRLLFGGNGGGRPRIGDMVA